ncbi:hypothetical protein LTR22_027534 [Elasticomyces elasticus]|nr:hypothetical protein LTR22_027534 [Elasticomyces elasticus]
MSSTNTWQNTRAKSGGLWQDIDIYLRNHSPEDPGNPGPPPEVLRKITARHPDITSPEHLRMSMAADKDDSNSATSPCQEQYEKSVVKIAASVGHRPRSVDDAIPVLEDILDNDACEHLCQALQCWHDLVVNLDEQNFSRALQTFGARLAKLCQDQLEVRIQAKARKARAKMAAIREAWHVDDLLLFAVFGTHCATPNLLDSLARFSADVTLPDTLTLLKDQRKTRRSGGAKTPGVHQKPQWVLWDIDTAWRLRDRHPSPPPTSRAAQVFKSTKRKASASPENSSQVSKQLKAHSAATPRSAEDPVSEGPVRAASTNTPSHILPRIDLTPGTPTPSTRPLVHTAVTDYDLELAQNLRQGCLRGAAVDRVMRMFNPDPTYWYVADTGLSDVDSSVQPEHVTIPLFAPSHKVLIIPIHLKAGYHWTLRIIDGVAGTYEAYDPLPAEPHYQRSLDAVQRLCRSPALAAWQDTSTFEHKKRPDLPRQDNGTDCGIYIAAIAICRMHEVMAAPALHSMSWRSFFASSVERGPSVPLRSAERPDPIVSMGSPTADLPDVYKPVSLLEGLSARFVTLDQLSAEIDRHTHIVCKMLHRTVERKRHYTQIALQKEQHATFLAFSPHHSTYRRAIENDVAEATKQCSAEQTRMRDLEGRFETLILYCQSEAEGCARQRRELVQQWVKEYTTFGQCMDQLYTRIQKICPIPRLHPGIG